MLQNNQFAPIQGISKKIPTLGSFANSPKKSKKLTTSYETPHESKRKKKGSQKKTHI